MTEKEKQNAINEVKVMNELDHLNVIRYHEYFEQVSRNTASLKSVKYLGQPITVTQALLNWQSKNFTYQLSNQLPAHPKRFAGRPYKHCHGVC
jgi:hypothetical protein